jgi:hypothetical protein|uniref:Uncharacterized protein n=1 Tax=Zea mays TaxID=4577 RepID=A0A804QES4_MAIZE
MSQGLLLISGTPDTTRAADQASTRNASSRLDAVAAPGLASRRVRSNSVDSIQADHAPGQPIHLCSKAQGPRGCWRMEGVCGIDVVCGRLVRFMHNIIISRLFCMLSPSHGSMIIHQNLEVAY